MNLVAWPRIEPEDVSSVTEVTESGIFVKGPKSNELSENFRKFISSKFCHTTSSCTHALHLALKAASVGVGDEVLVPNLTYVGTVSPVVNAGATPIFVDSSSNDYNISIEDISRKITARTKAIIPVHLHGYPCDIEEILKRFPDLIVIEDACQAHGARIDNRYVGTLGHIGCFSLNQVKPLCGGQGGLITTNDGSLYNRIKALASPGIDTTIGLSYEITETSAALAVSQLKKLNHFIGISERNYGVFRESLAPCLRKIMPSVSGNRSPVWHKLRIRLGKLCLSDAMGVLERHSIPYDQWPYSLVSHRSEYLNNRSYTADTPIAEQIMNETIVLGNEKYPFHIQETETIIQWAKVINEHF